MITKDQIDQRIDSVTDFILELMEQRQNIEKRIHAYNQELIQLELKLLEVSNEKV